MGSQLFEVLRQGIWASFTGGFFFDPRQPQFTNTLHFYLWLFLLALPLVLNIYFSSTITIWSIYSGSIGALFILIKLLNYRFHKLFDTTEPFQEDIKIEEDEDAIERAENEIKKGSSGRNLGLAATDSIELQIISTEDETGIRTRISPQEENKLQTENKNDLKVEIHRAESSGSENNESSSFSNNSEVSGKNNSNDQMKNGDSTEMGMSTLKTVVITEQNALREQSQKNSRFSVPSVESSSNYQFNSKQYDLNKRGSSLKHSNLKEAGGSLELGNILSKQTEDVERKKNFRRTKSNLETSFSAKGGSNKPSSSSSFLNSTEFDRSVVKDPSFSQSSLDPSREEDSIPSEERPNTRRRIFDDIIDLDNQKEESSIQNQNQREENRIETSDSEVDDQVRSRTPLLARHSSLEQKGKNNSKNSSKFVKGDRFPSSNNNNNNNNGGKKVSFSTRSLDGSSTKGSQEFDSKNFEKSENKTKSNMVIGSNWTEEDEQGNMLENTPISPITTRNSFFSHSPRPSTSTAPTASSSDKKFMLVPQDSTIGSNLVGGPFTSDWFFQSVSIDAKSSKFQIEPDIDLQESDSESEKSMDSNSLSASFRMLFGSDLELNKNNDNIPTKPFSKRGEKRTEAEMRPRRNKQSTPKRKSNRGRSDKEGNSSRFLERLLEENQDPSPSTSFSQSNISTSPVRQPNYSRHGRRRAYRNEMCQSHNYELTRHDSYGERSLRAGVQGVYRPREESLLCDIDKSTSTINMHRRLRRLAQSRREAIERRRETPYCSPLNLPIITTAPSLQVQVHVANNYNDTSEGAVHFFQDERGNWLSYTFNEKGHGSNNPTPFLASIPSSAVTMQGLSDFPPSQHMIDDKETSPTRNSTAGNSRKNSRCSTGSRRQGGISNLNDMSLNMSMKNASSSDSSAWSSESSELAVDSSTNKMYSSSRHRHYGGERGEGSGSRDRGGGGGGSGSVDRQNPTGSTSNQSVPSLTITPEFSVNSASNRLPLPNYSSMQRSWQRNRRDVIQVLTESLLERRRMPYNADQQLALEGERSGSDKIETKKAMKKERYYYKMPILPSLLKKKDFYIKVWFDRLKLMALFDSSHKSFIENLIGIFLAIGVALCGSFMLHKEFYQDLSTVALCFVMASCQFSILKSVQPDPSSPVHGFNRIVKYSRPIYFCLCGLIVLLTENLIENELYDKKFLFYTFDLTNKTLISSLRDLTLIIVLAFPFLFSIGLFPQFNTFVMFILEQIEIHIFGGNAASSLFSSFISVLKSILTVLLLYGLCLSGLSETQSSQHILFSVFIGLLISSSYHLSRCASDPSVLWSVLKQHFCPEEDCFGEITNNGNKAKENEDDGDPLPKKLRDTVNERLKSDAIICVVICLITFGIHASTVFTALKVLPVLWPLAIILGFLLHYVIPQMRKQLPCLLISHPILPPGEYNQFEVRDAPRLMWFEKIFVWLCFFERNIIYPLIFIASLTQDSEDIIKEEKFGLLLGSLIIVICGMKGFRTSFSDPGRHYFILIFTILFFHYDWKGYTETFLVDFFIMCILFTKVYELWLKLQFVVTYIAPWQVTWGSAFHAFGQPFSVPHTAMLFVQAVLSSLFSAPLNPFLGSAIFITSYSRPVKFWERDYNTKRVDHSTTRLATYIEKNPGADDNNLNSIFYEHLTRSLQSSLCGDLSLGRWGLVQQGDCFVLASDYLNALVHIVEVGNGLISFQLRGLEFRGTYCQQREVEAISEGIEDDDGFCCCETGRLPHMLSVNAAFSLRWLSWEVTVTNYVLEGYSISDNSAISMLQVFDLRKILITYYVKSIIFYTIKEDKFKEWLESEQIRSSLKPTLDKQYAELDPVFSVNIDADFDFTASGITRNSFCNVYLTWIQYCVSKKKSETPIDAKKDSLCVSLCFALSILGRRALGVAAHSNSLSSVEFFLYGLHALFKGDFRITSQRDEWVFYDMDLLKKVVSPAVRMSLKLHQLQFLCPEEFDDHAALFDAITYNDANIVISHEADPLWRSAILTGRSSLLALRHVLDDGADEYKIIMLNKRQISFRLCKLNRECVRGLWAGQQQELIYLRNRDPERGSIQNARQALRNIINSSCDCPIGYPIYVSPLTTSYADSHPQLCSLIGGSISFAKIKNTVIDIWRRLRIRISEGCSSGSSIPRERDENLAYGHDGIYAMNASSILPVLSSGLNLSGSQSLDGSQIGSSIRGGGSLNRGNFNRGGSNLSGASNVSAGSFIGGKPPSIRFLAENTNGSSRDFKEKELIPLNNISSKEGSKESEKSLSLQRVRIIDANQVYDNLNLGRRIDVIWPDESMRAKGGRNYWQGWTPIEGMEGIVVHRWEPNARDPKLQSSITDKTILLLRIEDKFVPINSLAVEEIGRD